MDPTLLGAMDYITQAVAALARRRSLVEVTVDSNGRSIDRLSLQ